MDTVYTGQFKSEAKAMCGEICQKVRNDGLSARDGIYEIFRIYHQFGSINELVSL